MKKAIGILIIFAIKSVTGDGTIEKTMPAFYNNMTIHDIQDYENPESVHWRHARDTGCSMCGRSHTVSYNRNRGYDGRMVGGPKVNPPNKYPWMVYLTKQKGRKEGLCGGALINEDFILTAAHCCFNEEAGNRMTSLLTIHFTSKFSRRLIRGPAVQAVYPHPEYRGGWPHDICLVKLARKVRCNENLSPICVPDENLDLFPGQEIIVAGWGQRTLRAVPIRELREAAMQIAPANQCGNTHLQPFLMCIVPHQGEFTCHGDSGVPFFSKYKDRFFLVGIYNGRRGQFCSNSPKIANSVPKHIKWIQQVTGMDPDYPISRDGVEFGMPADISRRRDKKKPKIGKKPKKEDQSYGRLCLIQKRKNGGVIKKIRYC